MKNTWFCYINFKFIKQSHFLLKINKFFLFFLYQKQQSWCVVDEKDIFDYQIFS